MKLRLFVTTANGRQRALGKILRVEGEKCVIGRRLGDIRLMDPACSGEHAIFFEPSYGQIALRDSSSTNGTEVEGEKIGERFITVGEKIKIGQTFVILLEYKPTPKLYFVKLAATLNTGTSAPR